jgi:iron complex outermembrane receptor protein
MKGKTRSLLILAVLIMGMYCSGTGISWGADSGALPTGATPDAQTVIAQADAAAPPAPAANEAPAQTTTTQSPAPSETNAAAPDTKNVPVTEVEVKAEKPREGSAEVGYKVENVTTTGLWGEMKLQDTPYSISVMPHELIENIQATTMEQLFRINPLVQVNYGIYRNDSGQVIMRGFNFVPTLEDGVRASYTHYGMTLEDVERVELLSGLSGFLYGPADVGGNINYVLKRPTAEPLYNVTVGNSSGGASIYTHGDFGGPIDKDGRFGYRLNVAYQDGDTSVDGQTLKRELVSGAVDWHISDKLLLQVDAAHNSSEVDGSQVAFFLKGSSAPPAPAADTLWTPNWSHIDTTTDKAGVKLTWDINDIFKFRTNYRYRDVEFGDAISIIDNITPNGTITNYETDKNYPVKLINTGYNAFVDGTFNTSFVAHKVTAGFITDTAKEKATGNNWFNAGINYPTPTDPSNYPIPSFTSPDNGLFLVDTTTNYNYVFGDEITFDKHWLVLAGFNPDNA